MEIKELYLEQNVNFCAGAEFFVRFLLELKKTKRSFEINWPITETDSESCFLIGRLTGQQWLEDIWI